MVSNLLAALVFFVPLLGLLEWMRRSLAVTPDVTRKLFFMGVASWAVVAAQLTEDATTAALPFLVLAGVMYLSFRFEIFEAVEDDGASLGSILLPLSCAGLAAWFWPDHTYVAVAAILAAGFGDTTAALVGRRLGTRKYHTLGHARTMEGTLTLFLVSGLAMAPVLALLGGLDSHQAIAFALIGATVAASVESVSVYGTDNVTVPLATAATLAALLRFSQ